MVGHITPEAFEGGPLAVVEDGDTVTIDAQARRIDLELPTDELEERLKKWRQPAPRYTRGVLGEVRAGGATGVSRSGDPDQD